MILHLLAELFYTLWPIALWMVRLSLLPLGLVVAATYQWSGYNWALGLYLAIVNIVGVYFLITLCQRLFKKDAASTQQSTKFSWRRLAVSAAISFSVMMLYRGSFFIDGPFLLMEYSLLITLLVFSSTVISHFLIVFWLLWAGLKFVGSEKWSIPEQMKAFNWLSLGWGLMLGWVLIVIGSVVVWLAIEPSQQYNTVNAHKLNAAIKNTCYLDPQREHCPQKLEDIGIIEPREYRDGMQHRKLWYRYYPQTHDYVLVVRRTPTEAIILSSKLKQIQDNDFITRPVWVLGPDRILGVPEVIGPITLEEFSY